MVACFDGVEAFEEVGFGEEVDHLLFGEYAWGSVVVAAGGGEEGEG